MCLNNAEEAQQLLILGNISIPLSYLVIHEITAAEKIYREKEAITNKIKRHILRSLAYVSYGLDRLDVNALKSYLVMLKQHENGGYEFDPGLVLSAGELSYASIWKEQLISYIDDKSAEKYLDPIGHRDFPGVALRNYELTLAIEYPGFGSLIVKSNNLKKNRRLF